MNENQGPISVLIPVELPVDTNWIETSLKKIISRPMDVILLHVVDTKIKSRLHNGNIPGSDQIHTNLIKDAEIQLTEIGQKIKAEAIQTMTVEGVPMLEIIKISKDLDVDMIAMKMRSSRQRIEHLFFGSTTERVIRGSSVPVVCLP